jgi:hypothetical protein
MRTYQEHAGKPLGLVALSQNLAIGWGEALLAILLLFRGFMGFGRSHALC